jgi:hypothetical protein
MPEAGFEPTIPTAKRPRPTPQTARPLWPAQLSYRRQRNGISFYETHENIAKNVENKTILQRNSGVSTPNILARKSEEGPLPYCRTGAESEGNMN